MSRRNRIALDREKWVPPEELLILIKKDKKEKKKTMYQRDRVELIVAFYAADHGGNSPTFDEIADVMKISRSNAHKYALELTLPTENRAVRRNGQYWLVSSVYTHPLIKERFPHILRSP
jgi:hypothetical protein